MVQGNHRCTATWTAGQQSTRSNHCRVLDELRAMIKYNTSRQVFGEIEAHIRMMEF